MKMNFKFKLENYSHEDFVHIMCTLSRAGYSISDYPSKVLQDIRLAIVVLWNCKDRYFYCDNKTIAAINGTRYNKISAKEVDINKFMKSAGISFKKGDLVKVIKLSKNIKFAQLGINTKVTDVTEDGVHLEDIDGPVDASSLDKIGATKPLTSIRDMKTDGNYRLFTLYDLQRVFYYSKIYEQDGFFEMFKTMFGFDIKTHLEKEENIKFETIEVQHEINS